VKPNGEWEAGKYARTFVILALAVFPTQILGKPTICIPPPPDPCGGKSDCVVIDDKWEVTVDPAGQIDLSGRNISQKKFEEYAAAWAKEGTWPIVVRGRAGTKYEQIASIVAMLRKAGVWTGVSCVAPQP
jgi:hypothetical protein